MGYVCDSCLSMCVYEEKVNSQFGVSFSTVTVYIAKLATNGSCCLQKAFVHAVTVSGTACYITLLLI